jgi:L-cysteate sulfo-lyase
VIRQGRRRSNEDVVVLHTGGAPALFAYRGVLGI